MSTGEDGEAAWSPRFIALPGLVKVHLPQKSEAPSTRRVKTNLGNSLERHERKTLWDLKHITLDTQHLQHMATGSEHHINLEITYTTFLVFVEDMENKDLEVHIGKHLSH